MNDRSSRALLERLIGFATVSRDSNLDMIEFIRLYLEELGVESELFYNAERTKANVATAAKLTHLAEQINMTSRGNYDAGYGRSGRLGNGSFCARRRPPRIVLRTLRLPSSLSKPFLRA